MYNKKKYSVPTVKVVEFRVELGAQTSNFTVESASEPLQAQPDGRGEVMSHNDWGTF